MNSIGDHFLVWLSGQSGRKTTLSKANSVASTFSGRFGNDDNSTPRILSNLHRAGHTEKFSDARTYFAATNPVLVVNDLYEDVVTAEWIGARARTTVSDVAAQFGLQVDPKSTMEDYSRIFLSGQQEQIQNAATAVGGNVEINPGLRLLRLCAPLSRESFSGEQAPVPYDQPLEMRAFSRKRSAWKRISYSPDAPSGLYRINERPIRWLWHESGNWIALASTERLWAAWLHCHISGHGTIQFDKGRGVIEIERIGFPLPVLIDRALRLIGGPPAWNRKHIVYTNVDTAVADQLVRVMRFTRRKQNLGNGVAI